MSAEESDKVEPSWQPVGTIERRVLGVLVEKAKTTPDAYPLTLNSITTGSNQKSNRSPLMQIDPIDAENALDNLRQLGAVSEVQGSGRTSKYRHRFYEWMGVDKLEAAVMAELLLRGEQTIGELRGRAARMEKIAGVAELRPILQSLMDKRLVQALTPAGRGQIVSHCLYLPEQQEKLTRNLGLDSESAVNHSLGEAEPDTAPSSSAAAQPASANSGVSAKSPSNAQIESLVSEVEYLKETMTGLEKRLQNLEQLIN